MKDFGPTQDLVKRAKDFALEVIRLSTQLPKTPEARVLGKQIVRSGTSVAANYRAVCRARSRAEFIAKLGTVVEEADETVFWLELLIESGISQDNRATILLREAKELLAIFSASRRTAKSGRRSTDRQITRSINR
jgi:four helix bundle protein